MRGGRARDQRRTDAHRAGARQRDSDDREWRRDRAGRQWHGRNLEASRRREVARWRCPYVGGCEVHRRRHQQRRLEARKRRWLRSDFLGRYARLAHRHRALQGDLRAVSAAVRARHPAEACARRPRSEHGQRLQSRAAGYWPLQGERMEDGRVHIARACGAILAWRRISKNQAAPLPFSDQHHHTHQPAQVG